jgi:hypothetical protein
MPSVARNSGHAERGRDFSLGRRLKLQQRDVGRGAMRRHRLHPEAGVDDDTLDTLQRRLAAAILHKAIVSAGLHAMRRSQHDPWRDHGAGAEIAARPDDGDDGARYALGRGGSAADNGVHRRGEKQGCDDHGAREFHQAEIAVALDIAKRRFGLVPKGIPC